MSKSMVIEGALVGRKDVNDGERDKELGLSILGKCD
jgi:hypothetical protein